MVTKVKKNWYGAGGKLFRKVLGKWNRWDRTECYRRKTAGLVEHFSDWNPDADTMSGWDRICASRKTAEADEKKPWIGKPWPKDAQGNTIRNPVSSASGERTVDVDSKGTNHHLKFAHQAAVTWKRLSKGAASLERGALKNGAAEKEMLLKYAHE
ncbi:MAG: hypothetical protein M1826_001091 [Phylliscum demangeonii]|nr:MAG: hypothetical protein M1826_001091 [Phylliscum demangeonii]